MFGDGGYLPDSLLGGDLPPTPSAEDGGTSFLPNSTATPTTYVPPHDTWGRVTIPSGPGGDGRAAGDPALSVILEFLKAFVSTDGNATAAWQAIYPRTPPIAAVFPHNPADGSFSVEYLPALYMWRESAREERAADDWLREITQVKALWVYPLALQDNQRIRAPFANTLAKVLNTGLERGRTPSWTFPNDPDPVSVSEGSVYWLAAGFESFALDSWKVAKLVVEGTSGERDVYPAIELTFSMQENFEYGLDRYAPLDSGSGGQLTLNNDNGAVLVDGPI